MSRPSDFDIQVVIDSLQGTLGETIQGTLDFYYPDMKEDDMTTEDRRQLDDQLFVCDRCGWWCETSQRYQTDGEGDYCEDCSNSEDE